MDNNFNVLIHCLNEKQDKAVIATIIKVVGSSYRKEGAMMLLKDNGESLGVLSVGCLEEELNVQAKMLLQAEEFEAKIIDYDLSSEDDLGWGRGAGCNGKITILIEKLNDELQSQLKKVSQLLGKGFRVTAIKSLTDVPNGIKTKYLVENGESFGSEFNFADKNFKSKQDHLKAPLLKNMYIHHFHPQNRLFIFGAGVDARPVATLATKLNFNVFVWDWRTENLQASYFPQATFLPPSYDWKNSQMTKNDFIVMMTHNFQKDKQLLQHFISIKQLKYIGILGPRKRTKRLLKGKEIPFRLRSPIGLHVGAEGPWEIAISILAEIIECHRKDEKTGKAFYHNRNPLVHTKLMEIEGLYKEYYRKTIGGGKF